jgi:hypothetical protein
MLSRRTGGTAEVLGVGEENEASFSAMSDNGHSVKLT